MDFVGWEFHCPLPAYRLVACAAQRRIQRNCILPAREHSTHNELLQQMEKVQI
jgi:hypothetical protein